MEWCIGRLTINLDTVFPLPFDEKYKNKYLIGINMLTRYKETLIRSGDKNYSNFLNIYEKRVLQKS